MRFAPVVFPNVLHILGMVCNLGGRPRERKGDEGAVVLNWLAENKEWLFSGAGILVLIGLGKLLWGTFSPSNPGAGTSNPDGVSASSSEPPDLSQGRSPAAARAAVEGQVSDLTPQDIVVYLDGVPDLQKPDAARHYRGIQVRWQGEVARLWEEEDRIAVMLCQEGNDGPLLFIIFLVDPGDYPGLGLVKSGEAVLTVEGVISEVRLPEARSIELTDARIVDGL